jgi:hypothetical protein
LAHRVLYTYVTNACVFLERNTAMNNSLITSIIVASTISQSGSSWAQGRHDDGSHGQVAMGDGKPPSVDGYGKADHADL